MIAANLTRVKEEQDMHHSKLIAVCLGLFTVLMTSVGSEIETRAIREVKNTPHKHAHVVTGALVAADASAEAEKIDIIRDNFKMFLIFGGAFGGAVVCVMLRMAMRATSDKPITRPMMGAYFSVSLLSAVFMTPLILKRYLTSGPEECFCYSFLLAGIVWIVWEIAFAVGGKIKEAAIQRGWWGVVSEVYGNSRDLTSVPAKPIPSPQVPAGDKLS